MNVKDVLIYFQRPNRVLPKYVWIYLQTYDNTQCCAGKISFDEIFDSFYFIKHFGNCEVIEMSFDMHNEENNYISILIKGSLGANNFKLRCK